MTPNSSPKHRLIRTDGTEQTLEQRPSFEEILMLIGCDCPDHVTPSRRRIMLVDDGGPIAGKPVNAEASKLYHRVCLPGTTHQIHGDVVILGERGPPKQSQQEKL